MLILLLAPGYMQDNKSSLLPGNTNNTGNNSSIPASIRDDYQKARYLL
ncbi:hypothetical protein [Thalassomonas haliotis]|uniref:Uncharacterized protein n=1 Tax=Thalassomonas haliotis TaxID=485448 RepID=A0ABY7V899_9GAMM|nr:hypothetical protein [Thalassomonas haliotis]WDE09823.1 hypothetical protein H3N35_16020 [Thalassomonas haliotis]